MTEGRKSRIFCFNIVFSKLAYKILSNVLKYFFFQIRSICNWPVCHRLLHISYHDVQSNSPLTRSIFSEIFNLIFCWTLNTINRQINHNITKNHSIKLNLSRFHKCTTFNREIPVAVNGWIYFKGLHANEFISIRKQKC